MLQVFLWLCIDNTMSPQCRGTAGTSAPIDHLTNSCAVYNYLKGPEISMLVSLTKTN